MKHVQTRSEHLNVMTRVSRSNRMDVFSSNLMKQIQEATSLRTPAPWVNRDSIP